MPTPKRVLLVDDDQMLRSSLAEQLAADASYTVVEAGSCADGRARAAEGLYEFMILDIGLPDGDGRALCRELRDSGVSCPIVLLTAAESDADTIEGLDAGANDYVTKPFASPSDGARAMRICAATATARTRNTASVPTRLGPAPSS